MRGARDIVPDSFGSSEVEGIAVVILILGRTQGCVRQRLTPTGSADCGEAE